MGKVFLAKDIKTGKKVAVKIVKDQDRWEREREILKKLNDIQGVPKLFFAGREEEIFLVMEYVEGKSLKNHVKICGKLQKKEMILWMLQICKVLEKVHKYGIVHMDLKPENIILHPSGKIYLIDFGVSLFEGETLTGYGTRVYASKEWTRPGQKATSLMDIYSLGKIMQLNKTDMKMQDVENIIHRCIEEDQMQRYQTVGEIRKDFQKILWKKRARGTISFLLLSAYVSVFLNFKDQKEKFRQDLKSNKMKSGMLYFYGNDETQKDLMLAKQYFQEEKKQKDKAAAYIKMIQALSEESEKITVKDLKNALKVCQMDVYDFWSAYFYEQQYVSLSEKNVDDTLKQAQQMLIKMQKFSLDAKKRKIMETEKINLYEFMAYKGEAEKFLKETKRVLFMNLKAKEAWEVYERRILYLQEQGVDLKKEFEEFLVHYPQSTDAYIEYIIYLCQKNQIEKAKEIYHRGQKQASISSDHRAQGLRRKLGL